jgi:hypothetical protein
MNKREPLGGVKSNYHMMHEIGMFMKSVWTVNLLKTVPKKVTRRACQKRLQRLQEIGDYMYSICIFRFR